MVDLMARTRGCNLAHCQSTQTGADIMGDNGLGSGRVLCTLRGGLTF